jgi:hypothetical protein
MTGSPNRRAYPRLEPDEGKLSCPVLRGGSASNDALLPDYDHFYKEPERGILEVACWAHYLDSGVIQSDLRNTWLGGIPSAVR